MSSLFSDDGNGGSSHSSLASLLVCVCLRMMGLVRSSGGRRAISLIPSDGVSEEAGKRDKDELREERWKREEDCCCGSSRSTPATALVTSAATACMRSWHSSRWMQATRERSCGRGHCCLRFMSFLQSSAEDATAAAKDLSTLHLLLCLMICRRRWCCCCHDRKRQLIPVAAVHFYLSRPFASSLCGLS